MTSENDYGYKLIKRLMAMLLLFFWIGAAAVADPQEVASGTSPPNVLDDEIQALKQEVITLNRELFVLQEELLYPSSTQIAVFLSLDVGKYFTLDSVQLKVDDKVVTNYLYTERELQALQRGGVQRLYMGNLKAGEHELIAIYTGKGPNGRDYRRGASHVLVKRLGPSFVELKIVDNSSSEQPDFSIEEWE
ncbi:MAG TPA: AraC family transcriptional regulator [Gammaproteobacteria bacterium]|nr:AraC family transcriptional regulator [Gammaproteobacteria bacterium]